MELDFFLVFLLAHLTGDFVLQTNKIAKFKAEGIKGLLMHGIIICSVQVVFLAVFGPLGLAAGVVCGIIHFFIDYMKYSLRKYIEPIQFIYFLVDQAIHIAVIYIITLLFEPNAAVPAAYIGISKLLAVFVILTYLLTIAVHIFVFDIPGHLGKTVFLNRHERLVDALFILAVWGCWFLPLLWSAVIIAGIWYLYYRVQNGMFMYKASLSAVKYLFFLCSSYFVYMVFK